MFVSDKEINFQRQKVINKARWQTAQKAEESYWNRVKSDPIEFLRIIQEKFSIVRLETCMDVSNEKFKK